MKTEEQNPAINVARYFIFRANQDGDVITPLKMQKLLYYTYVWTLIKNKKRVFKERFQAWPNGPVLPSVYTALKKYRSSPIDERFMDIGNEKELAKLIETFPKGTLQTIDDVYETYIQKSAFELVTLAHNEKPWKTARRGLNPTAPSREEIKDEDIKEEYGK